jgi:polysaccharide biosynthesis protein PslG
MPQAGNTGAVKAPGTALPEFFLWKTGPFSLNGMIMRIYSTIVWATAIVSLSAVSAAQQTPVTASAPPPKLEVSTPLNFPTYFGINGVGFFHRPKASDDLDKRWQLMKELGVRWDRTDMWWSEIEKQPGRWDYTVSDNAMAAYRDHHVQVLPILNYGAAWNDTRGPASDQERDQWANYVSSVVRRYRGSASYWEVWNEPNIIPFWRPQPDPLNYARLAQLTAVTARAANPDAMLVGFACADLDRDFMERVLELAGIGWLDVCSYHFYRTGKPETRTPDEVGELRLLLQHFGLKCPIWVTETGVTSNFKEGVSEETQAAYFVRQGLLLIGAGVDRVFPFTLVDNPSDPGGDWGCQLGLVTMKGRKKPAFAAYKTLIDELDYFELVGQVDLGENVQAWLYGGRANSPRYGQQKLVAWSTDDACDVRLKFDEPVVPGTVYTTLLGDKRDLEADGRIARLPLSASPVYLPVKSSAIEQNARTRWARNPILSSPGHRESPQLELPTSSAVDMTAIHYELPGNVHRSQEGQFQFEIPAETPPGWYTVRAQIPYETGSVIKDLRVWVQPEMRAQVRPFVTSATQDVKIAFTVHNQNLEAPADYSFEMRPGMRGVRLPSGKLEMSTASTSAPAVQQFAETSVTLSRSLLTSLRDTTFINFITTDKASGRRGQRKATSVFRFAVTPLADTAPTIDGKLNEFSRAPKMLLDSAGQVTHGEFTNPGNVSADVRALWTRDGLYVGADITDDFAMMNEYGAGGEVYKGDALEIYVSPRGYDGQYYVDKKLGDRQFALSPGRNGVGAVVSDFEKEIAGSKIAVARRQGGYTMEAFIPVAAFGGYVPARGDIIGWDVQVNDRDDYQGSAETQALMWNGDRMNWLKAGKWGMAVVK